MPLDTIASAVSRMSCSLTLHWNLFQLFQPIGGVFASASNFWARALGAIRHTSRRASNRFIGASPGGRVDGGKRRRVRWREEYRRARRTPSRSARGNRPRKPVLDRALIPPLLEQHGVRRREDLVDRQRRHAERPGIDAGGGEQMARRGGLALDAPLRQLPRGALHPTTAGAVGES